MTTAERQVAEALRGKVDPLALSRISTATNQDHDWGLFGQSQEIWRLAVLLQERLNELRRLAQAYQAMSAPIGGSREAIDRELALNRYLAELGE